MLSAAPADAIPASLGVNVHGTGPYASWVAVSGALGWVGFRHVRTGRVNVGQAGQRALASMCAQTGVSVLPIADDFGPATPGSRMIEVATQWGGVQVDGWEGPNEPQNGISTPANWPEVIATNGATSTDTTLGKAEVRRQLALIAQVAGGQHPVLGSALSIRNMPGWYSALGDVSGLTNIGNVHAYPGGWQPEHGWQLTGQRAESRACYAEQEAWITETGWHDLLSYTGAHRPTSPAAAATYAARLPFEAALAGFARTYVYELADEPTITDYSGHFGLFDASWTPKPAATALRNVIELYNDPDGIEPLPLDATILADPKISWALHARSDGAYLLALWQPGANVWDPTLLAPVAPATAYATLDFGAEMDQAIIHTPATGSREVVNLQQPPGSSLAVAVNGDLVVVELTELPGMIVPHLLAEASYGRAGS